MTEPFVPAPIRNDDSAHCWMVLNSNITHQILYSDERNRMSETQSSLVVGVPKETASDETRVALVPAMIRDLAKRGVEVQVQKGAGTAAGFPDEHFSEKGATLVEDRRELMRTSDIILQVRALGAAGEPGEADTDLLQDGQILISSCDPLTYPEAVRSAAAKGLTLFSLELVPRITRAQSMDILSSMATVAGYRAVLLAAAAAPRMFPMMMTAAGTLKPARVLIIGAGVAGLQAIATAKRLGAVVHSYDIRPAVREQVESLGGKFVELDLETAESESAGGYAKEMDDDFYRRQQEAMKKVIAEMDIVITTAAIPGKKAPILVTTDMVDAMAPGSVVLDLAAERGGNVECTQPGQTVSHNGVQVLGPCNLSADIPVHASEMFSRNIVTFLELMVDKDGQLQIDMEDEIIRDTLIARKGDVLNNRIRELLDMEPIPNSVPDPGADPESAGSESA